MLSHDEQLQRLAQSCPAAVPAAVVAGDPCFDRLVASRPLRGTYRAALGLTDGQRLVFVSSTWGAKSLFGSRPELVAHLRAELPLDQYAVALALHPNIWFGHSPWQIRQWLADGERDGVIVLPPEEGWRAGLVACDIVLGDFGSVTYYGAALGRPTLLAVRPDDVVDPASAVGRFIAAAPVLSSRRSLREQVESTSHEPRAHSVRQAASLVSAAPGRSHELLRREFYRLLALPEPTERPVAVRALPIPRLRRRPVSAVAVHVRLATGSSPVRATVERYAAGRVTRGAPLRPGAHLVVSTDEPHGPLLEAADIVAHDRPGMTGSWLTDILRALPGALLATLPISRGEWRVGARDGTTLSFTTESRTDGRVWASVAYAWISAGHDLRDMPGEIVAASAAVHHRAVVRVVDVR